MKKWNINGLSDSWITSVPFKTEIVGSRQTEFSISGILTGKVVDSEGNPVHGAKVQLTSMEHFESEPAPALTNREGIFIRTLIPAGNWDLTCTKDGYSSLFIKGLSFEKGEHVKKSIIMRQ